MVDTNGRPSVPDVADTLSAGTGHGWMAIVVVAVAPQAEVAVIVAVPEAAGVPEMMLPRSVKPAGRLAAVRVAPGAAVIVETNGRPTVPMRVSARTVGAAQESIVRERVACAPQAAVTVIVAV